MDDNLRPWLLEVNASPSLGASNKDDLRLKKQMVGDVLDIVDVEGRQETAFFGNALAMMKSRLAKRGGRRRRSSDAFA